MAWQLAQGSTADNDRRTAGQSEPDDQEYNKYGAHSDCDSLEEAEKEQIQSHGEIVQLSRRLGEITMVTLKKFTGL